jgi:hypothetical protein
MASLQSRFFDFLMENLNQLETQTESDLTRRFVGYLCRISSKKQLTETFKRYGLHREMLDFRKELDCSMDVLSRLWRAIWSVAAGERDYVEAANYYKVNYDDMMWVTTRLSRAQRKLLVENARTIPWVRDPALKEITKEVMTIKPYAKSYIYKNLKFIADYDHGTTLPDLVNDMLAQALAAAHRYSATVTDLKYLRNLAWRSAKNWAVSTIKRATTKGRARIERTQTEVMAGPVIHRRRPAEAQTGHVDVEDFLKLADVVPVDPSAPPRVHMIDAFKTTTLSADAVVGGTDGGGATLMDTIKSYPTFMPIEGLDDQPEPIRAVCSVLLGRPHGAFEAWMAERGASVDTMKPSKVATAACEFFGVSRKRLKSSLKPVLTC